MCDICKLINSDPKYTNGARFVLRVNELLKYGSMVNLKKVNLCYLHDIEFFVIGERRFLERYYNVKFKTRTDSNKITSASSSGNRPMY